MFPPGVWQRRTDDGVDCGSEEGVGQNWRGLGGGGGGGGEEGAGSERGRGRCPGTLGGGLINVHDEVERGGLAIYGAG